MKLSSLSGVLLAYHEEKVIEGNIVILQKTLESVSERYEVIVVGFEGCRDETNRIVQRMSQADSRIRLVIQPASEKGYGRAFAMGLEAAKMDWAFQSDADGQYVFDDLRKLVDLVDPSTDLIHGYRAIRNDPKERIVFAFFYNLALKALYGIPLRDVDSAFKLIRVSAIRAVRLSAISGFAVSELVIRLMRTGSKFKQIPVTHLPRIEGEALAEKGIENPFGLQIPNFKLVFGTLSEMWSMRRILKMSSVR